MCGIAGIFDTEGTREIDQALLARMNQAQHHRGPDETGLHAEPGIGLAGMEERAELLGGWLRITSRPADGTRVELSVPVVGQQGVR